MRFGLIYDNAIGIDRTNPDGSPVQDISQDGVVDNHSPAEDAAHTQTKLNWLASTPTELMMKKLQNQITDLLALSVMQAVTYPTHQNHLQIIQNLVRVSELQKTIEEIKSV